MHYSAKYDIFVAGIPQKSRLVGNEHFSKNLIIIDRVGVNLKDFRSTSVLHRPEMTLGSLLNTIRFNPDDMDLKRRKNIIFHAGTNDIPTGMAVKQLIFLFDAILKALKAAAPAASLFISCIIHRPADFSRTKATVRGLNIKLQHVAKQHNVSFIEPVKTFLFKKQPDLSFYEPDGLTLSPKGSARLAKLYQHALSPKNQGKMIPH